MTLSVNAHANGFFNPVHFFFNLLGRKLLWVKGNSESLAQFTSTLGVYVGSNDFLWLRTGWHWFGCFDSCWLFLDWGYDWNWSRFRGAEIVS
jgi:hypothetical protein